MTVNYQDMIKKLDELATDAGNKYELHKDKEPVKAKRYGFIAFNSFRLRMEILEHLQQEIMEKTKKEILG